MHVLVYFDDSACFHKEKEKEKGTAECTRKGSSLVGISRVVASESVSAQEDEKEYNTQQKAKEATQRAEIFTSPSAVFVFHCYFVWCC